MLYTLLYDCIYGPDAQDPLCVLTMIVTLIHSYCPALCLCFTLFTFIYSHCSVFLHCGIIHLLHQQSPYVQESTGPCIKLGCTKRLKKIRFLTRSDTRE